MIFIFCINGYKDNDFLAKKHYVSIKKNNGKEKLLFGNHITSINQRSGISATSFI